MNDYSNERAVPRKRESDGKWYCSKCRKQCMVDSRGGSFEVILMCQCNPDDFWGDDRR